MSDADEGTTAAAAADADDDNADDDNDSTLSSSNTSSTLDSSAWEPLPPMLDARCGFACAAVGGCIVVAGGLDRGAGAGCRAHALSFTNPTSNAHPSSID